MIRRPPRSTLFPTRRSSDLVPRERGGGGEGHEDRPERCDPAHARSGAPDADRKSTRLNSSHSQISYAVFCLKKKTRTTVKTDAVTNTRCLELDLHDTHALLL